MSLVSFEKDGVVSIWLGRSPVEPGSNFLRDRFGVEYYDPDDQECIVGKATSPVRELAARLSYSASFLDSLVKKAEDVGVMSCLWVFAQYDFLYDSVKAGVSTLPIEPLYLGSFAWVE